MTEQSDFITLRDQFDKIKWSYDPKNRKYIHVRSIEHFLTHADTFLVKHHKDNVHNTLQEYFDIIAKKQIDNERESEQIFYKYIMPLGELFSDIKGFHFVSRPGLPVFVAIIALVLLIIFDASIYWHLIILIIAFMLIGRYFYFRRQKRTFGYMH